MYSMKIVPVINCLDKVCVQKHWAGLQTIGAHAVHFDVADGMFAPVVSPLTPQLLRDLLNESPDVDVEVHLMVQDPEVVIQTWLEAGARRVIVHIEAIRDLPYLMRVAKEYDAILVLGIAEKTEIKMLVKVLGTCEIREAHLLEVSPGFSGQGMNPKAAERIRLLRISVPDIAITVDGGIIPETLTQIREAGALRAVSSSFIWESVNPREAYELLKKIGEGGT